MPLNESYVRLLDRPTVFILGAGASRPYGFPTGPELWHRLRDWCNTPEATDSLRNLGNAKEDVSLFLDALRYPSKYATIDHLLEAKPRFRKVGAEAVAINILKHEVVSNVLQIEDWYLDLFHGLGIDEVDAAPLEKLSIVTFNYDRSLEHFLAQKVELHTPDALIGLARRRASSLKIVHAHGSLGSLSEVAYGKSERDDVIYRRAAGGIKLIGDGLAETAAYTEAKALIDTAENLVFLGFGYHQRILAGILSDAKKSQQRAFGTGFQLMPGDVANVEKLIDREMLVGHNAQHCKEFLNSAPWDRN